MALMEDDLKYQRLLNNRVALITGASRGIGAEIAKELASYGATVVINYFSSEVRAKEVVRDIQSCGSKVTAVQGNVGNPSDMQRVYQEVIDTQGKVDILINNAGITRDAKFVNMSEEAWNEVISTNMMSLFHLTKLVLPNMIAQNFGRIVNITSIIGQSGGFGQTNYSAAKAGMIGFTKSLALETARHNITVNCVAPGYTFTDMVSAVPEKIQEKIVSKIPLGRFGAAHEIAKAVRFLTVDGDYITGQTLNVNGGMYM